MDSNQKRSSRLSQNYGDGFSTSRVTRHASRSSSQFSGNWLVNYQEKQYSPQEILKALLKIQDIFVNSGMEFGFLNANINNNGNNSQYFKDGQTIYLNYSENCKEIEEIGEKPKDIAKFKALKKPIRTISLLFPRLESDHRWKTMGLPAGQILLSSCLKARGFEPSPLPLAISGKNGLSEALSADLAGITLFEDLLPLLGPILADFRLSYGGILAAGGPFPTLAPMAAIYHLPEVNLLARGEAELALPDILKALNEGDAKRFFAHEGIFWQRDGVIAMAGFDKILRPGNLESITIDLGFMKPGDLDHGLEMNFSRGCRRGCLFCCRAQGTKFRKLPIEKAGELLNEYRNQVMGTARRAPTPPCHALNINDDDILQDPDYAREIFDLVKKNGLRIFGIQTSTASLVDSQGTPIEEILDLVSDKALFVENRPLLWLGTDAFLPGRARRLGKKLPPPEKFRELMEAMERLRIRHYHYWISSDGDSTWPEFVEELGLIFSFFRDFPNFGLLAHAPFIVPYPSSALFARLPVDDPRLKIKLSLEAPDPRFSYKVVERLETSWPQLNCLLHNDKAGGEKSFFDFLKERDLTAAAQLVYHFLKQEMLQNPTTDPLLLRTKEMLEKLIAELLVSSLH